MVVCKSYGYCDFGQYTSYNPLMFWMQSFCFVNTAPATHVGVLILYYSVCCAWIPLSCLGMLMSLTLIPQTM
jgi:hypothetical protein